MAALLSELLPLGGAANAGTVRNWTRRVGEEVVQPHTAEAAKRPATRAAGSVVVGLDGGYVRGRHPEEGRHFEVIAGKVTGPDGVRHRFAFPRNGQNADTPATVLADGEAGLWRLQREVLPNATVVLDWWHAAVRFEHALDVRTAVLNGTLEDAFRRRYPGFRAANDRAALPVAA